MEGYLYVSDLSRSQFGAVAHGIPVLAVIEGAAVLRNIPCPRFGWSQLCRIAGTQTHRAVRNIPLVTGHSQGNSFPFSELRVVTGIVAVSAVRDIAHVV